MTPDAPALPTDRVNVAVDAPLSRDNAISLPPGMVLFPMSLDGRLRVSSAGARKRWGQGVGLRMRQPLPFPYLRRPKRVSPFHSFLPPVGIVLFRVSKCSQQKAKPYASSSLTEFDYKL